MQVDNTLLTIVVAALALLTSLVVFPVALAYAQKHGIVDNPNARKLQRVPVPVFGGVVVYCGILMGGLALLAVVQSSVVSWGLLAMTIMLIIGVWDDMRDISVLLRLVVEILLVVIFIFATGLYIDDLHGLWGIWEIDPWFGIPFSVFVGVGVINAINLIDGVDGYSSGYGMLACFCFALAFWTVWSPILVGLALIVVGALFPFFLHNVFGVRSRMYIGDGGTLMLGMLMVVLAFTAISSKGGLGPLEQQGICIPAFLLAVGCIPLFDTVRVMTMRILRGRSPFSPDRTHLHHMFVDMRFSHLGAALAILMMNSLTILLWLLSWWLGFSMDIQMYVVIFMGLLTTFGVYKFVRHQQQSGPVDDEGYPEGTPLWHALCKIGMWTHREDKKTWRMMNFLVDGPMLWGGG